ncbi:MAG: hypothetical protein HXS44_09500 [Theionarchaea archaeon]|nr:hypothetical protein [Theionarchaea archaeon]
MRNLGIAAVFLVGILISIHIPYSSAQSLDFFTGVVEMQERNVQVTVYYYKGEERWGQHIFDTTISALPILEELAGFPYPHGFDVEIYPKKASETSGWNAQNLGRQGIWFNRDRFTPDMIEHWSYTAVIIHENAHYWSDERIYGKPWLKEGFCELFTYLTLEKMGRHDDARRRRNDWSYTCDEYRYYNIPLDLFEYELTGPGNETTHLAYSKSALFCCEIYERYGLDVLKEINEYLFSNGISANSFSYMNLLNKYTQENQEDLFMEWVFPKRVDIPDWEKSEEKIRELEELVDASMSHIEEVYKFHRIMDFVEFQMHIDNQIKYARSSMEKYDFEKALQIIGDEIEEMTNIMSEFDGYAVLYFEAEEYYNSVQETLGEIPKDRLITAKEHLISFKYDLSKESIDVFYEEIKKLETYQVLHDEWCRNGCTSFEPLDELLLQDYDETLLKVDSIIFAIQEYDEGEKELSDLNWVARLGIIMLGGSMMDLYGDMEEAREEITCGDAENALHILTSIHHDVVQAGQFGIGIICVGLGLAVLVVKLRKNILNKG